MEESGTHQKTISRIPEQMYSPSDTGMGMAWGGSLFTSVSNKHRRAKMRALFQSFPGPLLKSGMGRLEWPREGSLFELDLNKRWDPKHGHYSSQLLGHY